MGGAALVVAGVFTLTVGALIGFFLAGLCAAAARDSADLARLEDEEAAARFVQAMQQEEWR